MGGTIQATDTPGGGLTVDRGRSLSLPEGMPLPMTKVLVIDDEPQILRALRINLSVRGYEVITAAPGPLRCAPPPSSAPTWWCWTSACPTCRASRCSEACVAG